MEAVCRNQELRVRGDKRKQTKVRNETRIPTWREGSRSDTEMEREPAVRVGDRTVT